MVFWKPFAVPGYAGFVQPYEKATVPVTGVTVYSWTMLLIIREGPGCWLQRMETIVPKVATWHLLLKTHTHTYTHNQAHHESMSAHADASPTKHVPSTSSDKV